MDRRKFLKVMAASGVLAATGQEAFGSRLFAKAAPPIPERYALLRAARRGNMFEFNFKVDEKLLSAMAQNENMVFFRSGETHSKQEINEIFNPLQFYPEKQRGQYFVTNGEQDMAKAEMYAKMIEAQNKEFARFVEVIRKTIPAGQDILAKFMVSAGMMNEYDYAKAASENNGAAPSRRYPYQAFADGTGVCDEKSRFAAALLKEMGVGTAMFIYDSLNHAALGVKTSSANSYGNTGYAFNEISNSSIPTDTSGIFAGGIKVPSAPEQMVKICDGIAINFDEEAKDAARFAALNAMNDGGALDTASYREWLEISFKYQLHPYEKWAAWMENGAKMSVQEIEKFEDAQWRLAMKEFGFSEEQIKIADKARKSGGASSSDLIENVRRMDNGYYCTTLAVQKA